MHEESALSFPDPWDDPDFSSRQVVWRKSARGSRHDQEERHPYLRLQARIWVVSLVLLALLAGLLFDPMVGPLIVGVLMALGLTLVVLLGTMGLGIMGFGLFAAGEHVIAWLRQGTRWPDQ
jgi:hypothetical protein